MKLKCVRAIASTDKKVLTPFKEGEVYPADPLTVDGKQIPNEFSVEGERQKKTGGKFIAISGWPVGIWLIPGIAKFEVAE